MSFGEYFVGVGASLSELPEIVVEVDNFRAFTIKTEKNAEGDVLYTLWQRFTLEDELQMCEPTKDRDMIKRLADALLPGWIINFVQNGNADLTAAGNDMNAGLKTLL